MLAPKKSKKKRHIPLHYHVKKGDTVVVIAGKSKGQTGVVKHVFRSKGTVLVDGVNFVTKAVRPNPMLGEAGGLVKIEAPLYVSKVMLYDAKNNVASRVKTTIVDGKPVRALKKNNEVLDA